MALEKFNVVFVLGLPGSGKGTQCTKIASEYGYVHLSAGDLLREERSTPGSEFGELIETHIVNGTIVPVEITCRLIENAMVKSGQKNFLLDGFPRNQNNLEGWNKMMGEKVNVKNVLFFSCTQDVCRDRCLARGAAGSGRSDDNEESLKKRFVTATNSTLPIVDHYRDLQLVSEINADREIDKVYDDVKVVIDSL